MPRVHQVVCYIVLALALLQFLWIGLAILGGLPEPGFPLHVMGGYLATLLALVAVALAALGRREALAWTAGLLGALVLQILLVELSAVAQVIGALHPVNALLVLYLADRAARGETTGARGRARGGETGRVR